MRYISLTDKKEEARSKKKAKCDLWNCETGT